MKGLNRIGNMLVPNNNYCKFEDWIMPILNDMLKEQKEQGTNWTPSKVRWLADLQQEHVSAEIDNSRSITMLWQGLAGLQGCLKGEALMAAANLL